jgi:hypothetical protein
MNPQFLATVTVMVRPGVFDIVETLPSQCPRSAYRRARSRARWHRRDPVFGYLVMFDVGRVVGREARNVDGLNVEHIASDLVRRAS